MANATSTAQVVVKGNTAHLQRELKKSEKAISDFKDVGQGAMSSIGDLLGVNTGKIGDMLASVKKLSAGFQAMGSAGGTAFAGLSKGAATLAGGVAAIGISGLVAGFKELNKQAELFAQTDFGSDFVNVQQGMRDTYDMAFMQFNQQNAANWLYMKEDWKTSWKRAGRIAGEMFAGGLSDQAIIGAFKADQFAMQAADNARPYLEALEEAKDYMRDQSMVWAENNAQIQAYLRTAKDVSKTEAERNQALWLAQRIQKQTDNQRIEGLKKVYEAAREANDKSLSPEAGIEDVVNKFNAWQEAIAQSEQNMTSFVKIANRINKSDTSGSISSTAKEVDHLSEAIKSLYASVEGAVNVNKVFGDSQDELKVSADAYKSALEGIVSTYGTEDERVKGLIDEYRKLEKARDDAANVMTRIEIPTATVTSPLAEKQSAASGGLMGFKAPELSEEGRQYLDFLQGMVYATERANEAISDAIVDGISSSIQYLADALWGLEEMNAAGIFSALLTPLAEACIQMGELIMAEGLASKAFQESLTNPYAAIAAGAALVAVGALVKAGLNSAVKSVSGGGYSTSVASSAYSSSGSGNLSSYGREMEVKVSGTLTADGSKLVAVLNNENNRASYTT